MLDISWTEFVLIGVVALIVIGPKELPGVMRTMGQWTRRLRSMAADFQNQFQEAMREAEMADLKKQVDEMAHDIKNYDPLKEVRADIEAIGKDVENSAATPQPAAGPGLPEAAAQLGDSNVAGAATGPVALESADKSAAEVPATETAAAPPASDVVAAAAAPVAPEPSEDATQPDSTRRAG